MRSLLAAVIVAVAIVAAPTWCQSAATLLEKGIFAEETEGDLEKAMGIYEQIAKNDRASRPHVAQALYRLGICRLKKGQEAEARETFEDLIARFPEQKAILGAAREQLTKLKTREAGRAPTVARTVPPALANDVDPALSAISVTFDQEMQGGSWAWVQPKSDQFPETTGKPSFDLERRTCTLPVKLEPGRIYQVGINGTSHPGFKSESGSAKPYLILFATRSADGEPTRRGLRKAGPSGWPTRLPADLVLRVRSINGAPRQRHFVRLVVGKDEMTFEGQPVPSWEKLPPLFAHIPRRWDTVLELARASDDVVIEDPAEAYVIGLTQDFGFEYLSKIGVHPLGSRGSSPQAPQLLREPRRVGDASRQFTNSIGMTLVIVEPNRRRKGTGLLEIAHPFSLGTTEVTQEQWQKVMGTNPSRFKRRDRPVEMVSWEDCVEFCRKLSEIDPGTYRLPSVTEWEYACRAGSTGRFCFGDDESLLGEHAWYGANSGDGADERGHAINGSTHPVGGKKPNAWGLYDMHGNVYEWCSDEYEAPRSVRDRRATRTGRPDATVYRVFRGGSYYFSSRTCQCSFRTFHGQGECSMGLGFRVVLEAPKADPRPER